MTSPFIRDFFAADGHHPRSDEAIRHFERAFVEPAGYHGLFQDLRVGQPATRDEGITPARRVVIVDGHPRSGKTWAVAHAINEVTAKLGQEEWWTSGMDSLKTFPTPRTTLEDGLAEVTARLEQRRGRLRLVLLDDLLGTNTFRPWKFALGSREVERFFIWNEANPWIQCLAPGGILVLTGRSLFFTLADILFQLRPTIREPACAEVGVVLSRRGIFQTADRGEVTGGFDAARLSDVAVANWRHHPLAPRSRTPLPQRRPNVRKANSFVFAAPLTAFDPETSKKLADSGADPQKYAAQVLFGDDFNTLAQTIQSVVAAKTSAADTERVRQAALVELRHAYVFMVAPGFVFIGPKAYSILHPLGRAQEIATALYYTDEQLQSGRLPNRFYMGALEDHFRHCFDFAARIVVGVLEEAYRNSGDWCAVGLGIRGVMERSLWAAGEGGASIQGVPDVEQLVGAYPEFLEDELLRFELHLLREEPYDPFVAGAFIPGLAAAVGWALFEFARTPEDRTVRERVVRGFVSRFIQETATRISAEPPGRQADCILPFFYNGDQTRDFRDLIATYSTFLQWMLKLAKSVALRHDAEITPEIEAMKAEIQEYLSWCLNLSFDESQRNDDLARQLLIVAEDEVLWARGGGLSQEVVSAALLERGFRREQSSTGALSGLEVANRYFSIAWHNEWQGSHDAVSALIRDWLGEYEATSLKLIGEGQVRETAGSCTQPIHDNLRYHWIHFITQRATWMRDWCFQEDPNAFELDKSQIDLGVAGQRRFANLAERVVRNPATHSECCLRNVVFLVGIRAPDLELDRLRTILRHADERSTSDPTASRALLQAIFELARQDHFERLERSLAENPSAAEFMYWAQRTVETAWSDVIAEAWRLYADELLHLSYPLDLLPRNEYGWRDVIPKSWTRSRVSAGTIPDFQPAAT